MFWQNIIKKTKKEKQNVLNDSNKKTKENESVSDKDATIDFIKRNIEVIRTVFKILIGENVLEKLLFISTSWNFLYI